MKMINYKWIDKPVLCQPIVLKILEALKNKYSEVKVSLNLGLTEEVCKIVGDSVVIRDSIIELEKLEEIVSRSRDIYYVQEGELIPVSIIGEHFYKLVLVKWGHPPTLEIDGIHMHRVKDFTPDVDTKMKLSLIRDLKCCKVLDTCTGLGYTAIESIKRGACQVITFEIDENVLKIAHLNPWSRWLEDSRIKIFHGDVSKSVEEYREYFDIVIHDPPRISLAGELYGLQFYQKLAKTLKTGGRIVHYVGQPGILSGKKIWKGVMERMRMAGFDVKYDQASRCVYGWKR
ncbi:MAG: RsmD family RNA methyltransferase [Aigarchaeota archaeon]|nr:RsmD family RNA methyltransferase [Aigarchaeota archaeon]